MSRTRGIALSVATPFAVALSSAAIAAPNAEISVKVEGCAMNERALERLVRRELSTVLVAIAGPRYEVSIACGPGEIRLRIDDPLTHKALERTTGAPRASEPEPERVVALSVAQLYRASWLELAAEDRVPLPPGAAPSPPQALSAARALAVDRLEARRESSGRFGARGGVAVRGLGGTPLAIPRVELAFAWAPARGSLPLWLSLAAHFGTMSATRATGVVAARDLGATIGVAVEPLRRGAWSGFLEAGAGATQVSFDIVRLAPGFTGAAADGIGFDGTASAGAAVRAGPVRLDLSMRAGALLGVPRGLVASDQPVSLNGAWIGGVAGAHVTF